MANNTLSEIGRMLLKELPSAEDTPNQKSIAQELLRYANIAPTDKPQFQRKIPAWILLGMAEKSQPVRTCIDAVVRECTRSTQYYDRCWDFYPKDAKATIKEDEAKVPKAPPEVPQPPQTPPEAPPIGKAFPPPTDSTTTPPAETGKPVDQTDGTTISRAEYKDFQELLFNPDRRNRRSTNQIICASLYDLLVFDDAFISIAFENKDVLAGKPVALYNEESDGMEIRVDLRGNIGDDTWFCDQCKPEKEWKGMDVLPDAKGVRLCPDHKLPMRETAYVQTFAGKVRARWSKEEIIHIHIFRAGGRGYGSPPLMSLFFAVSNLMAMDQYFSDAYALQRTPRGFVVFNGVDQSSVSQSAIVAEETMQSNPMSIPWFALPEGKSVEFVSLMTAPKDMQSVDFYNLYTEMVYKTFHVTPIVAGTVASGKSGNNPNIQLDVQNDFIRAYQRALAEAINNSILPERFNMKSWYWGFTPVEEGEEQAEANTQLVWAQVAKAWEDARFDVVLDEDGKPFPSDNIPKPPQPIPAAFLPNMGPPGPGSQGPETGAPKAPPTSQPSNQTPQNTQTNPPTPTTQSNKGKTREWYALLTKAAPSPPKNPDWVSGMRGQELDFYAGLNDRYKAAVDQAVREIGALDNPTKGQVSAITDKALDAMKADLVAQAKASLGDVYDASFEDAVAEAGLSTDMVGQDQAALDWMESGSWSGVESVLPEFADDQKAVFSTIINEAYQKEGGISTAEMVAQMKTVSNAETWKLARIVRSEITLISNNARADTWKKLDKEGLWKYDWSDTDDACEVCANITMGNPYTYDDLAAETTGGDGQPFRPHPFCRCTVVRHVLDIKE